MKKTYIIPEALIVALNVKVGILEGSLPINQGGATVDRAEDILTKENKDINLWDEEW